MQIINSSDDFKNVDIKHSPILPYLLLVGQYLAFPPKMYLPLISRLHLATLRTNQLYSRLPGREIDGALL